MSSNTELDTFAQWTALAITTLIEERDQARNVAASLEAELAWLRNHLADPNTYLETL